DRHRCRPGRRDREDRDPAADRGAAGAEHLAGTLRAGARGSLPRDRREARAGQGCALRRFPEPRRPLWGALAGMGNRAFRRVAVAAAVVSGAGAAAWSPAVHAQTATVNISVDGTAAGPPLERARPYHGFDEVH